MSKQSLQQAIDLAGGQLHLARGIRARIPGSKITQPFIWGWLNSVKSEVPPAEVVLAIADLLDYRMTPHDLRPDLYPNPSDGLRPHLAQAKNTCECAAAFGGFGERRAGIERREGDRRKNLDEPDCDMGEPRDGDRRIEDRRSDCAAAEKSA